MSRRRRLTARGAVRVAWKIHRDVDQPQDVAILCPVNSGGAYCQWVAGHYGGCVLGRFYAQPSVEVYR